jgi:hypothetical protein
MELKMFHITAILEGHVLVAERTENNCWQIKILETLSGKTKEGVWSDEELGATLSLAVTADEAYYAYTVGNLAEDAAFKMIESEGDNPHMFRLIP